MSPRRLRPAAGVTLIELMVALAIGAVLVLGLVQVFAASRTAYATAEGMGRVQENARFAMDFLQHDIRMVGHFGCVNDQAHWIKENGDLVNHLAGATLDFLVSVQGYEANSTAPGNNVTVGSATAGWNPALPSQISALSPLPGSDIITMRYLDGDGVPVDAFGVSGGASTVSFPAARVGALTSGGVAAPTLFGVADCAQVDVFQGSLAGNTVTATSANFTGRYTPAPGGQTKLYRAESLVYYVANGASGRPALWRARGDHTGNYPAAMREELVEGVESLQFLYGLDATPVISLENPPLGDITTQQTANVVGATAAQWRRVGLVQVGVLASSPDPSATGEPAGTDQQPRVLGVRFAPPTAADGRYRASYESTVALRNRLFGN